MEIQFIQQDGKRAQIKSTTDVKHGWSTAWYKMTTTKKGTFIKVLGQKFEVPADLASYFDAPSRWGVTK